MLEKTRLPADVRLPMPFRAYVYPTPGAGKGAMVKGKGHITLGLDATADSDMIKLRIKDIWVKIQPSRIAFDIDRDGELECIDIPAWILGAKDFDLEASHGQYNLKTKHISLKFVFSLDAQALEPLVSGVAGIEAKPIRFEIAEQGWLDLETGAGSTHSHPFTIPDGPFKGLTILGGQFDPPQCDAHVTLGVAVIGSAPIPLDMSPEDAPKSVWICPNTRILLLWNSSNADSVEISPDLGVRDPHGYQVIPGTTPDGDTLTAIDRNLVYTAQTLGSCNQGSDQVNINVLTRTEEFYQTAEFNNFFGYWTAYLPNHTYDDNILVYAVSIDTYEIDPATGQPVLDPITNTPIVRPDSITSDPTLRWRLDHEYPGVAPIGMQFPHHLIDTWVPAPSPFPLPGSYRFTLIDETTGLPILQPTDDQKRRKVYFRLRAGC